jgi:DNA polymerase-2
MTTIDGWLVDIATSATGVTLWIKDHEGTMHAVATRYEPAMYMLPRASSVVANSSPAEAARSVGRIDQVSSATVVNRRARLEDTWTTPVLEVRARDPPSFKALSKALLDTGSFDLFNIDIPVFQEYLYETGLFPFARARFDVSSRGDGLVLDGFERLDARERLVYSLPPLRAAWIDVVPDAGCVVDRARIDNPIKQVAVRPCDGSYAPRKLKPPSFEAFKLERGRGVEETDLVRGLVDSVRAIDPDIILTHGGDETVFPYLCARASALGLASRLRLSRTSRPLAKECFHAEGDGDGSFFSYGKILRRAQTQFYLSGRIHVDADLYGSLHFQDGNIPGLIEVARVSSVPVQRLNRITIGGALQSIQFQIAHDLGILIPHVKRSAETFKTGNTLLLADRGGHILEPETGVFDHVISLDFTSMYPTIMDKYNISPETVNCACCPPDENVIPGLGYHVCTKRRGLIPEAIALPLHKRIAYKHMARRLGDEFGAKVEHMQEALKWVLVVSFGYLGFKNARFGRVEAHQAVCAYSREMLLQATRVVQEHGLHVIHGIVDSLWAQDPRHGLSNAELDAEADTICAEIERATRLPIESDGIYKFIVFLPSVIDPEVGTLNHYWGVFTSGKVKVRGIEMRRHDSPPIVKAMQKDVIKVLASADDREEFLALVPAAHDVLDRYIDSVRDGSADPESLVVTTHVSKDPGAYRVDTYQAVAAKQLAKRGVVVQSGQSVRYVITNAASPRPNDRVLAWDLFADSPARPDVVKYAELLGRAFRNMFPFPVDAASSSRAKQRQAVAGLERWIVNESEK